MRPLPAPVPPRPRTASVQRTDVSPSAPVLKRGVGAQAGIDPRFLAHYQDWQGWVRRYARTQGIVHFTGGIAADTISRVIPRVEELTDAGDWVESEDPRLVGIFNEYTNPRQSPSELVRLHAWYYGTVGEMIQTVRDQPTGVEYGIWSTQCVDWDKPQKDFCLVRYVPDGKVGDETAFALPRKQATRFWIPDEEWQAYATSPMAAAVDDLHRLRAMTRYARLTADSALAMNGIVWSPDDGFESSAPTTAGFDENEDPGDVATPSSLIEDLYYGLAKVGLDGEDITAIAPAFMHWAQQYGPPQYVKVGEALDPNGIAHRDEARQDFARGTNLPASLVVGGGPGDANHWTEWLVDRKFFDSAIAPTADRIFHMDLTATFLVPRLRIANYDTQRYRLGYDPMPVIVNSDQSDKAIPAWLAGLLGPEAALEMMNIDADKLATPAELERLFSVLTAKKAGDSPFAKLTMSRGGPSAVPGPPPGGAPGTNGNASPPTPVKVAAVLGQALLAMAGSARDDD